MRLWGQKFPMDNAIESYKDQIAWERKRVKGRENWVWWGLTGEYAHWHGWEVGFSYIIEITYTWTMVWSTSSGASSSIYLQISTLVLGLSNMLCMCTLKPLSPVSILSPHTRTRTSAYPNGYPRGASIPTRDFGSTGGCLLCYYSPIVRANMSIQGFQDIQWCGWWEHSAMHYIEIKRPIKFQYVYIFFGKRTKNHSPQHISLCLEIVSITCINKWEFLPRWIPCPRAGVQCNWGSDRDCRQIFPVNPVPC